MDPNPPISINIADEWKSYISNRSFPCVAAKASIAKEQHHIFVAGHMGCPADDDKILEFIYKFADNYRNATSLFHSAVVLFSAPEIHSDEMYDSMFWARLQALSDKDARNYDYDARVDKDPDSDSFSFSLKGEAFFVIGLHPKNERKARQFSYPAMVFNPHEQFEHLKDTGQYSKLKHIIRKNDFALSGSINPMLQDFGQSSEAFQYTGKAVGKDWKCPLKINHEGNKNNKSA